VEDTRDVADGSQEGQARHDYHQPHDEASPHGVTEQQNEQHEQDDHRGGTHFVGHSFELSSKRVEEWGDGISPVALGLDRVGQRHLRGNQGQYDHTREIRSPLDAGLPRSHYCFLVGTLHGDHEIRSPLDDMLPYSHYYSFVGQRFTSTKADVQTFATSGSKNSKPSIVSCTGFVPSTVSGTSDSLGLFQYFGFCFNVAITNAL